MKWLTRLVAALLVVCLIILVIVEVVDHTILSASFLEQKAKTTNSYSQLASALSNEVLSKSNLADNPTAINTVHKALSADVLQAKLNSVLNQTIAHYKSNGPIPTVDLSVQQTQLQSAGLQLGSNNPLAKPIVLKSNDTVKLIASRFEEVKLISLIASLALIAVVLFLSWERHRYAVLPDIAFIVGILLSLIGTAFSILPSFSDKYINFNSNSDSTAFLTIAHNLADAISRGIGMVFIIIGLVLMVVGVVVRFTIARPKPKVKLKK